MAIRIGAEVQYFLYREYSSYRHELIDLAEGEAQARSLACEHSRLGRLIISVRKSTPAPGEKAEVCSFLRGLPHIAGEQ